MAKSKDSGIKGWHIAVAAGAVGGLLLLAGGKKKDGAEEEKPQPSFIPTIKPQYEIGTIKLNQQLPLPEAVSNFFDAESSRVENLIKLRQAPTGFSSVELLLENLRLKEAEAFGKQSYGAPGVTLYSEGGPEVFNTPILGVGEETLTDWFTIWGVFADRASKIAKRLQDSLGTANSAGEQARLRLMVLSEVAGLLRDRVSKVLEARAVRSLGNEAGTQEAVNQIEQLNRALSGLNEQYGLSATAPVRRRA